MASKLKIPNNGAKIEIDSDLKLHIPNKPIIPYITGDGIGEDITPSMQAVVSAAVNKAYGLKKDFYYDERMDFIKSTKAACKYLKYLYKRYDDWYLAFAAYNTGETRIDRHIKHFKTKNFWELDNLPKETQNYIPSLMAIIFISKNPEKYGFNVVSEESFKWTVKKIARRFGQISHFRCIIFFFLCCSKKSAGF